MLKHLITAALLATAAPALAAPADDLKRVLDEHWAWFLQTNPVYATTLGTRSYDDRVNDLSLAEAVRIESAVPRRTEEAATRIARPYMDAKR